MEGTTKTTPSIDEATIEQTEDFVGEIPRIPPVRRWKSALIKTAGALFILICVLAYSVFLYDL